MSNYYKMKNTKFRIRLLLNIHKMYSLSMSYILNLQTKNKFRNKNKNFLTFILKGYVDKLLSM